jgi:hypothetical protein
MKLTPIALKKIDVLEVRLRLALSFGVTERQISKLIKDNRDNGRLTTAAALQVMTKVKSKSAA